MALTRGRWVYPLASMVALMVAGCCSGKEEPTPSPATGASTAPAATGTWKAGDRVDVEWKGSWWQATILSVEGDKYKVHYIGWGANWDEVVPASRVRAATPGAQKGSGAEGAAGTATAAPAAGGAGADAIPAIPEGRSKPPTVAEWGAAKTVNTQEINSQPEGCFLKIVREWLKVNCEGKVTGTTDMVEFGTENADYFQSVKPGKSADFVVRIRKGKTMKLKILRSEKGNAALFVNWPQDAAKPTIVALGRAN